MTNKKYYNDLYLIGYGILFFISVYVLIKNVWGYAYFFDFLESALGAFHVSTTYLYPTPIGQSLGYSVLSANIINTIVIVMFTVILAVSSYGIMTKIKIKKTVIPFKLCAGVICAVVFLIASFEVIRLAAVIFKAMPFFEELKIAGPINMRDYLIHPFMTHIQPDASTFWFHIIPYLILNAARVIAAYFISVFIYEKRVKSP